MLMIEYIDSNSGERCLRRKSVNIRWDHPMNAASPKFRLEVTEELR